ncbi:hypothetical protein VC83_01331 [Pseudogymnoascus destructans]|uniref:Uncharacterized protein n=1 Tax=Pseudogymnoascus destructans TaxID=655981 RepID=A0A177AI98_9PEZI|nr:uncharacterized protein VC83_01331 [Pseudogymnoascus destructans]OAF61797.1 hypothetical protein VC83_01331 [Pseudogymnoascus destructans]
MRRLCRRRCLSWRCSSRESREFVCSWRGSCLATRPSPATTTTTMSTASSSTATTASPALAKLRTRSRRIDILPQPTALSPITPRPHPPMRTASILTTRPPRPPIHNIRLRLLAIPLSPTLRLDLPLPVLRTLHIHLPHATTLLHPLRRRLLLALQVRRLILLRPRVRLALRSVLDLHARHQRRKLGLRALLRLRGAGGRAVATNRGDAACERLRGCGGAASSGDGGWVEGRCGCWGWRRSWRWGAGESVLLSWCAGCLGRACAAASAATTAGIVARAELLWWGLRGRLCLLLAGVGGDVLS